MYEVCESRRRVVALVHFSMACCQARPERNCIPMPTVVCVCVSPCRPQVFSLGDARSNAAPSLQVCLKFQC